MEVLVKLCLLACNPVNRERIKSVNQQTGAAGVPVTHLRRGNAGRAQSETPTFVGRDEGR
jgi:hypothetical protein